MYKVKSGAFNVTIHVYAFYDLQHGCVPAWSTISWADVYTTTISHYHHAYDISSTIQEY